MFGAAMVQTQGCAHQKLPGNISYARVSNSRTEGRHLADERRHGMSSKKEEVEMPS